MNRLFFGILLLISFQAMAELSQDSDEPASPETIHQVVDIYFPSSQKNSAELNALTESVSYWYAYGLDNQNKEWGPNNPNWGRVQERIKKVLNPTILKLADNYHLKAQEKIAENFTSALSEGDGKALITFYRSSQGKRFKTFQDELDAVYLKASTKLGDVKNGNKKIDMAGIDENVLRPRTRLIVLSRPIQAIEKKYGFNQGADNSGSFAIVVMIQMSAILGGEDLDRLSKKYAKDVPEFERIAAEPLHQKVAEVFSNIDQQMSHEEALQMKAELDETYQQHFSELKEFYEKLNGKSTTPSGVGNRIDCNNPKLGDASTCTATNLIMSNQSLNAAFQWLIDNVPSSDQPKLKADQAAWLTERINVCRLSSDEANSAEWISKIQTDPIKTQCVVRYTNARIAELNAMIEKQKSLSSTDPHNQNTYTYYSDIAHDNGQWYFEVLVNAAEISQNSPVEINTSCSPVDPLANQNSIGFKTTYRPITNAKGQNLIGFAIDLNKGKIYSSMNGEWAKGRPDGTGGGLDIPTGKPWICGIKSNEAVNNLIKRRFVEVNFGNKPFFNPPPSGYKPYKGESLWLVNNSELAPEFRIPR
jgi:uncharacterized protein YecT (DUF1311 family)